MSAAQGITVVITYGYTYVFLSDEIKHFACLFYLKLYGNIERNMDKARANAQRDAHVLLLT